MLLCLCQWGKLSTHFLEKKKVYTKIFYIKYYLLLHVLYVKYYTKFIIQNDMF